METLAKKPQYYDRVVFWTTTAVYIVFLLFLITAYSPFKVLRTRYANRTIASTFFPARYNVYTKSPGDVVYKIYKIDNGKPVLYDLRPFSSTFLFGLRRDYKIVAEEMICIMHDTTRLAGMNQYQVIMPRGAQLDKYILADTLKFNIIDTENVLFLHGKYILTKEMPLKWDEARAKNMQPAGIIAVPVNIVQKK